MHGPRIVRRAITFPDNGFDRRRRRSTSTLPFNRGDALGWQSADIRSR